MELIIADDDSLIREGLKLIISSQPDLHIIGTAENGKEAVRLCRENKARDFKKLCK